jgi:hypothetical protein
LPGNFFAYHRYLPDLSRLRGRLPEPATEPADLATITVQDHDDPTAPLRVIEVS